MKVYCVIYNDRDNSSSDVLYSVHATKEQARDKCDEPQYTYLGCCVKEYEVNGLLEEKQMNNNEKCETPDFGEHEMFRLVRTSGIDNAIEARTDEIGKTLLFQLHEETTIREYRSICLNLNRIMVMLKDDITDEYKRQVEEYYKMPEKNGDK